MISVEEALDRILAAAGVLGPERVLLDEARGRVLAEALVADRMLPPWDNSAMDGYAVRAGEVVAGAALPLAGVGGGGAGHVPSTLPAGHAARIMTGAPVPAGADAIVMREDSDEADGRVRFTKAPRAGAHIRRAGEDVAAGSTVLPAGTAVGAGEIGIAAALGRTVLAVRRRPRVAIVSTGDELVEPDRAPGPGQIVDSNGYALAAQCADAGALPVVLPSVRDDRAAIRAALAEALEMDVVISTGGVSVGEFDFVKEVLADLGVVESFWKVRMKPGKPAVFGTKGRRLVFGLPGNPASSMVGFELFVRPALRKLAGHGVVLRPRAPVLLDEAVMIGGRGEARRQFVRALVRREDGILRARPNARQGSGMLRSMVGVNALLDLDGTEPRIEAGTTVNAILLEAL